MKRYVDYEKVILDNGLEIILVDKPYLQKTYAAAIVKYGSNDIIFEYDNKQYEHPLGIAHFLEHKMFEKKDGDLFTKLSKLGTEANAYTSFNQTVYHLTYTRNHEINIKTLLELVFVPYFTKESVQKEKGIIEQEIQMYKDKVQWISYFGVLKNLFSKYPFKYDIAGTIDSINVIDEEMLYESHAIFYKPNNVQFVIIGDLANKNYPEIISNFLNEIKVNVDRKEIIKKAVIENELVKKNFKIKADIDLPIYNYAKKIKIEHLSAQEKFKLYFAIIYYLENLFSNSSEFKNKLVNDNILTQSFNYYVDFDNNYLYCILSGKIKDENKTDEIIEKIFNNYQEISTNDFMRIKNNLFGEKVKALDSTNDLGREFFEAFLNNIDDVNVILNIPENIKEDEIKNIIEKFLKEKYIKVKVEK